jgi:hypothetical protein
MTEVAVQLCIVRSKRESLLSCGKSLLLATLSSEDTAQSPIGFDKGWIEFNGKALCGLGLFEPPLLLKQAPKMALEFSPSRLTLNGVSRRGECLIRAVFFHIDGTQLPMGSSEPRLKLDRAPLRGLGLI